mgnify:CR=1 FL=1
MQTTIARYLGEQTCATICCVDREGLPHCFNCFYAFDEHDQQLYFKSQEGAMHSTLLHENGHVAGTILPDKLNKLMIQGIQFQGVVVDDAEEQHHRAASCYYTRHPMALAKPGHVWIIQLEKVKMTENSLGFGKKITWERSGTDIENIVP